MLPFSHPGTKAERVILVGDSAGGNFAITVAMKAKELGLRVPDSILSVYPSVNSTSAACPSRIMAMVDPLLPLGIMQSCQEAYAGVSPSPDELKKRAEYREKLHKARGYYTYDPDAKDASPQLARCVQCCTWVFLCSVGCYSGSMLFSGRGCLQSMPFLISLAEYCTYGLQRYISGIALAFSFPRGLAWSLCILSKYDHARKMCCNKINVLFFQECECL